MREKSKNTKILIGSLICLLVIICVIFLRIPLKKNKENMPAKNNETLEIYRHQNVDDSIQNVPSANYTLKLENNLLNLYMKSSSNSVLLESIPINATLFPADDITILSDGITVKTLEEGISIIEDFTS